MQRVRVVDRAFDENVDVGGAMKIHDQRAIIDHDRFDPGLAKRLEQQLFSLANQRMQQAEYKRNRWLKMNLPGDACRSHITCLPALPVRADR